MDSCPKTFLKLIIIITAFFSIEAAGQKTFGNPVKLDQKAECISPNIDMHRFSDDFGEDRKTGLCQALDEIARRLNDGHWSAPLEGELEDIWRVFSNRNIFFAPMPPGRSPKILAMVESFPVGSKVNEFSAALHVKEGIEDRKWFYHVILHELRHVYDFYEMWTRDLMIPDYEIERRAFRLMSAVDEETPEEERFSKVPSLWKDKWKKFDRARLEFARDEAIAGFLKKSLFYKNLDPLSTDRSREIVQADSGEKEILGGDDLSDLKPPKLVRRDPAKLNVSPASSPR